MAHPVSWSMGVIPLRLALFIGAFEHVERFRKLKFAVKRITNIQSTFLKPLLKAQPPFILLLNNV